METQFTYLTYIEEKTRKKKLNIGIYTFPTKLDFEKYSRESVIALNKLLDSVKLTFDVDKCENDLEYNLLRLVGEPSVRPRRVSGLSILGFRFNFEYNIETSDLEEKLESVGFKKG